MKKEPIIKKIGHFDTRFAWLPVRIYKLTPARPDCFQFWKEAGWVWLRTVCKVENFLTGDVVYFVPNEKLSV